MGLGWKFWLGLIGLCLVGGIAASILFAFIGWAWYAWGVLGVFIFFGAIFLAFGYFFDRRQARLDQDPIA